MQQKEQEHYSELGGEYWWLGGKYNIICDLLLRHLSRKKGDNFRILDAGCGPGNMYERLARFGEVHGTDFSEAGIFLARGKGYSSLTASPLHRLPYRDNFFDVVVALDVFEHMPDDRPGMKEVRRVLKNGGFLVVSVPAYKFLWGGHDEKYGHFRRYTRGDLKRKLKAEQFGIVKLSYIEPLFLVPLFLMRKYKKIFHKKEDDFVTLPPWVNTALRNIITLEKYILRVGIFPFGVSIVGVAQKTTDSRILREVIN